MPYPNEHSARIKDPGSFDKNPKWKDGKPGQFRRKNIKAGISIIIGQIKGAITTQAYRFNIQNYTAEKAKKWLKDNKIKYIRFEKATKGK